jgi:hypothetical protein
MSTENATNPAGTIYCCICWEHNPAKANFCLKCGRPLHAGELSASEPTRTEGPTQPPPTPTSVSQSPHVAPPAGNNGSQVEHKGRSVWEVAFWLIAAVGVGAQCTGVPCLIFICLPGLVVCKVMMNSAKEDRSQFTEPRVSPVNELLVRQERDALVAQLDLSLLTQTAEQYYDVGLRLQKNKELDRAKLEFVKVLQVAKPRDRWRILAETRLQEMSLGNGRLKS